MKTLFTKMSVLFALLTTAAFAQTQPIYPFVISPIGGITASVDKFSSNPIVQISTPITVTLAPGVVGNRLLNVSIPPLTDINGNINSGMFTFRLTDGFNNYTGTSALVYPNGTTTVTMFVDVSKVAATAIGVPVVIPVLLQDASTGYTQSISVNINVVDGRQYVVPASNVRILPHLASGAGWETVVEFTNQNVSNTQLRVDFFDQSGNPYNVRLADGRFQSTIYVVVNGRGTTNIRLSDPRSPSVVVATARVTPTIGFPVGITTIFRTPTSTGVRSAATPAQLINTDNLTFFFDATPGNALGLALTNSLNYSQPLTLTYYDEFGNYITATTETLCAGCQIARTLDPNTFPAIQGKRGTITASLPAGFRTLNGIAFLFDANFFFIPVTPTTNTIQ